MCTILSIIGEHNNVTYTLHMQKNVLNTEF